MKMTNTLKNSLQSTCSNIHLIDKCLIIIMFLLLIQSANSLFLNVSPADEINTIDIIIRTATASIFGYFLSSNFIRHSISDQTNNRKDNGKDVKIMEINNTKEQNLSEEVSTESHLQIIITTSIAIFCLLVLIFIRNSSGFTEADLTASSLATISQFRDLVSGCIGFLIGVPTSKK